MNFDPGQSDHAQHPRTRRFQGSYCLGSCCSGGDNVVDQNDLRACRTGVRSHRSLYIASPFGRGQPALVPESSARSVLQELLVAVASPPEENAQWPKSASAPCRPRRRGRHEGVGVWESFPGRLQGFTQQNAEVSGQGQPSLVLEGSNQVERSITPQPGRAQGLAGNLRPSGRSRESAATRITENVRRRRAQTALFWEDEAQQESGRGVETRSMKRRSGHRAIFGKGAGSDPREVGGRGQSASEAYCASPSTATFPEITDQRVGDTCS